MLFSVLRSMTRYAKDVLGKGGSANHMRSVQSTVKSDFQHGLFLSKLATLVNTLRYLILHSIAILLRCCVISILVNYISLNVFDCNQRFELGPMPQIPPHKTLKETPSKMALQSDSRFHI